LSLRIAGAMRSRSAADRRSTPRRGFTLVELMIVMAVVAILAAIAVPSYSAYVIRSKRAAARVALLQDAQFMERTYTVSGCYSAAAAPCGGAAVTSATLPIQQAPQDGVASYTIGFAPGSPTPAAYGLVATQVPTFVDATCGNLTLDNVGNKGISIAGANATQIANCWQR